MRHWMCERLVQLLVGSVQVAGDHIAHKIALMKRCIAYLFL